MIVTVGLTILSVIVLISLYLAISKIGRQKRAYQAMLQGFRWLIAGVVIATFGDVFDSGSNPEKIVAMTAAMIAFVITEYQLIKTEDEGPFDLD